MGSEENMEEIREGRRERWMEEGREEGQNGHERV